MSFPPRSVLFVFMAALLMTHDASAAPSEPLAALCDEYWQEFLEHNPLDATSIGDRRYDERLRDESPAGRERETGRLESMLDRAKDIDAGRLDPADRVTRSALIEEISGRLDRLGCTLENWLVDPINGPQVQFLSVVDYTKIDTPADAERFVKRCRAMGPYLDQHIANLKTGLAVNRVAPRAAVVKVVAQLERIDLEPLAESPLMKPLATTPAGWPAESANYRQELIDVLGNIVKPAFRRYLEFLKTDVLPVARPDASAGMRFIPGGETCYWKLVRVETSVNKSPEELHEIGLAEIARIRKEMGEVGARVFGTSDFAEIQKRVRSDPAMYFTTADQIVEMAKATLARAREALPRWFNTVPKTDCVVEVMGMHEAPQSYVAYYREPSADGSRPGAYVVNTYKPETRTRYEAQALAFHESIPGHHLQIALNQEMEDLPQFRRFRGSTAFVEGWALYAERLADEMGLYSGDLDRIGMLSYDAWRASRLVVDTGLHAMGWSRDQAVKYMTENTLLASNNIENEVDRYLVTPAQALAYKTGQLEILRLRAEAKDKLGERFDIRAFHDEVLKNGAVALPVLKDEIESMIAAGK